MNARVAKTIDIFERIAARHQGAVVEYFYDEEYFGNHYVRYRFGELVVTATVDRDQPIVLVQSDLAPTYEVSMLKLIEDIDPALQMDFERLLGDHGMKFQAELLDKYFEKLGPAIVKRANCGKQN